MRKLINTSLIFLSVLCGLAMLLAYLSVYINPQTFWFLGMVGLMYPLLLLLNLAFLFYWIVRWKWPFMIPLLSIFMGVSHFSTFFQFPFGKENVIAENDIKVVTYNVNLFHLFAWSDKPPTYNDVFAFLNQQEADIITLQEFYVTNSLFTESMAKEKMPNHFSHIDYITKRDESSFGMVTFSKHPIINTGEIKFDDTANACIFTDIVTNTDTIRIYNSHLQSLKLKERNMNFLHNQEYRKDAQAIDEIKDISFRYRDALRKRAKQVDIFTNHILRSPYPAIVCGDFNDSPISYNYNQMRKNLNDAFVQAGSGVGYTYKGLFPSFRIDYILYNPKLKATSYYSPKVNYSDHYPVVATLRKKSATH